MIASHTCYSRRMADVASRELRNNTRRVLDRVQKGETVVITVDGRPVAEIRAVSHRPRWLSSEAFVSGVLAHQADAAMADDIRSLADETTDELPLR